MTTLQIDKAAIACLLGGAINSGYAIGTGNPSSVVTLVEFGNFTVEELIARLPSGLIIAGIFTNNVPSMKYTRILMDVIGGAGGKDGFLISVVDKVLVAEFHQMDSFAKGLKGVTLKHVEVSGNISRIESSVFVDFMYTVEGLKDTVKRSETALIDLDGNKPFQNDEVLTPGSIFKTRLDLVIPNSLYNKDPRQTGMRLRGVVSLCYVFNRNRTVREIKEALISDLLKTITERLECRKRGLQLSSRYYFPLKTRLIPTQNLLIGSCFQQISQTDDSLSQKTTLLFGAEFSRHDFRLQETFEAPSIPVRYQPRIFLAILLVSIFVVTDNLQRILGIFTW